MSSIIYKCRVCGAENKLEDKFCPNCGAENVHRVKKIAKLESKQKRNEKRKERTNRASKRKNINRDRQAELVDKILTRRNRTLRLKQSKLETGNTHEGKLRWIKTQRYDLERSIQEIADDLCESIIAVANYIDEIENQKNE